MANRYTVVAFAVLSWLAAWCAPLAAQDRVIGGAVGAEGLVANEEGRPIWAEIKPDGTVIDICPDTGGFSVMAGATYRAARSAYSAIKAPHETLTAKQYYSHKFVDATGAAIAPPALKPSTFSVAVRTADAIHVASDIVLLESPIDVAHIDEVGPQTLALLMGPCPLSCNCGAEPDSTKRVAYRAETGKVAFKTAYYVDHVTELPVNNLYRFDRWQDPLLGPIQGATVDLAGAWRVVPSQTDSRGHFVVRYNMPSTTPAAPWVEALVTVDLQFDSFDPQSGRPRVYSTFVPTVLLAQSGGQVVNVGLQVAMLTGKTMLRNEVRPGIAMTAPAVVNVAAETSYDAQRPTFTPAKPPGDMDLDGDGKGDTTTLENGVVKVWLGGSNPATDPPDLTRLPDRAADLTDRGLVAEIAAAELEKTDVFVYRLSTMQRIGARRASTLPLPWPHWAFNPVLPTNAITGSQLQFDMLFRGPRETYAKGKDVFNAYARGSDPYSDWGASTWMLEELTKQPQGHLNPGEPVKIYVINRATGYIGSAIATVAGSDGHLTFQADAPIAMRAPNLRVKAERTFKPPAQERRDGVLVGYEGSAMTRDDFVTLSYEWVDWDGTALPADLPGFTGRFARVVSAGNLGSGPNTLGQFAITPGAGTKQIELPEQGADTAHFYLHVHPYPLEANPDFSGGPGSEGRPARYVPVLVPVYDEAETWKARKVALAAGNEVPGPVHSWVYRPEMQFSLLDLDLEQMTRTTDGGQTVTKVLGDDEAHLLFSSSDQRLDFLYTLLEDDLPVLDNYGPDRELVFALGDQEVRARVGEDGELRFTDLERLTELSSEDLFSLRLYQNGDDSNVLWSYVLEYLALDNRLIGDPREEFVDGELHVTPEDNVVNLQATLLGYSSRAENDKDPNFEIRWTQSGTGSAVATLSVTPSDRAMGTSTAQLTVVGGRPGDRLTVTATLASDPSIKAKYEVVVRGGAPQTFSKRVLLGAVSAGGVGEAVVTVGCHDSWGNPVPDGTSIDLLLSGDAQLEYLPPELQPGDPAPDPLLAGGGPGTVKGEIRAKIIAGAIPTSGGTRPDNDTNEQAKLTVTSGTLSHEFLFDIHPVTVRLEGNWSASDLPLALTTQRTVTATVIDWQNHPVQGAVVTFAGTHTILKSPLSTDGASTLVATDIDGKATATFGTGFQQVEDAKIVATVGHAGRASLTYSVGRPNMPLQAAGAVLIADRTASGTVDHTRPDNSVVGLRYEAHADIVVTGAPGSSLDVQLGDLTDPNIQPVVALHMYGLGENAQGAPTAPDENGLHDGIAEGIVVLEDSIMGGANSYVFREARTVTDPSTGLANLIPASRIVIDSTAAMQLATGSGFRVELKPNAAGGPVFRHRSGVEELLIDSAGYAVYRIRTRAGASTNSHEIRSALPLALREWHAVAGRFKDGQLELVVDGVASAPVAVPAAELLAQGSGPGELVIGDGFRGGMKSFNWYDWSAPALTRFAGGGATKSVTFDGTGRATLRIDSTGQLNEHQSGAKLRTMRVSARAAVTGGPAPAPGFAGELRQFISLTSLDAYYEVASSIVESPTLYSDPNMPELGPVQLSALQPARFGSFVPTAHAAVTLSDIWTAAGVIMSFFIPWDDAVTLATQIYKLITGAEDFSWSELVISGIGVLSILPILKPLKPFTFILRKVTKLFQASKFMKIFAGAMKQVLEFILSKKGQRLLDIAPFLIMIAEIAFTDDGQELIGFVVNTIESADDFWAWVRYFNLPVGGWAEGSEPPEVELLASADSASEAGDSKYALGGLAAVPVAHAASGAKAVRANAVLIRRALRAMKTGLENAGVNPRQVIGYVRMLKQSGPLVSREVSRMIRDPKYLAMQIRIGIKKGQAGMKEALQDKPTDRIRIRQLAGIIAYLTAARAAGKLSDVMDASLATKIGTAFVPDQSNRHGARFHLMMMAELHLMSMLPINGAKVGELKASEATRVTPFYDSVARRRAGATPGALLTRHVDLITTEPGGDAEIWWELKSLTQGASNDSAFKQWRMSTATITFSGDEDNRHQGAYHRQFVGDRVAHLLGSDNQVPDNVRDDRPVEVRWTFQKFLTSGGQRSIDDNEVKQIRTLLCANPDASPIGIEGVFGKSPTKAKRECGPLKQLGFFGDLLDLSSERITVNLRGAGDRLLTYLENQNLLPVLEDIVTP